MMKKLAAMMVGLAMLCAFAGGATAADAHGHCSCGALSCSETAAGHEKETFSTLTAAGTYSGNHYYLANPIEGSIVLTSSGTIYLCLNGQTITGAAGEDAVQVTKGNLVLCDCSAGGTGLITHKAGENGRGVYLNKGSVTIYGVTISGNTVTDADGGGVYAKGNVEIIDGTISGNTARNGGGVYVATGDKTLTITGGTISDNNAAESGGGVRAQGNMTMSDVTISGNSAAESGGGVYVKGIATISGSTISDNAAKKGGGVYHDGDGKTLTITDVTISGNTAESEGGGVWSKDLTMSGGTISENTAANGNGGGVYAKGIALITGGTISGNTAKKGGGVYHNGESKTLTITGGTISGNAADSEGGGVWAKDMTMSGGAISGNTATNGKGGGMYAKGNTLISGGTINDNKAKNGGGVYAAEGNDTLTMSGGAICGNTAGENGGGVYAVGDVALSGGTIGGNTATNGNGGGVYWKGSEKTLEVSGSVKVTGNTDGNNNDNNLYLPEGQKMIQAGAFENDAVIGVTTQTIPEEGKTIDLMVPAENVVSDLTKLSSDSGYEIKEKSDGTVELDISNTPIVPEDPSAASADSSVLPKTGDASMLGAWIALFGASAAAMRMRRKK